MMQGCERKLLFGMILFFVFFIGCANQEEKIQDIKGNGMPESSWEEKLRTAMRRTMTGTEKMK